MLQIQRTTGDHPDFAALIELLDRDLWGRYPDTQQNFTGFNIMKSDAKAVVAYDDGVAVGCGCYRDTDQVHTVEMKRMYVKEEMRGRGIAKAIMYELEAWAADNGNTRAILETGSNQPEAISLYQRLGYVRIANYEPYLNNEASVCMGKDLATTEG